MADQTIVVGVPCPNCAAGRHKSCRDPGRCVCCEAIWKAWQDTSDAAEELALAINELLRRRPTETPVGVVMLAAMRIVAGGVLTQGADIEAIVSDLRTMVREGRRPVLVQTSALEKKEH